MGPGSLALTSYAYVHLFQHGIYLGWDILFHLSTQLF